MKFVLFFIVALFAYNNSIIDVNGQIRLVNQCYGQTCPQNATYCLKLVNTTRNGQFFTFQVECLNSNFTPIATFNSTRANVFGPVLSIQGVTLSNVYRVPSFRIP